MNKENHRFTAFLWGLFILITLSACNLTGLLQKKEPPKVKITAPSNGEEIVAGDTITISFEATSSTENMKSPVVELTLDSVNGQSIASYGSLNSPGKTSPVANTLEWIAQQPGEHTLYLTAHDEKGNASTPDTIKVTVLARPQAVVSGTVTLQNNQSYEITTQLIQYYDGTHTDIVAWKYPEGWRVQGPDSNDVTSAHLYSVGQESYKSVSERLFDVKFVRKLYTNSLWDYGNDDFIVTTGELYLFKRAKTPGGYILIQALDENDDSITLEYVVFDITR